MKLIALCAALLSATSLTSVFAADMGHPPIIYPPVIQEPVMHHGKMMYHDKMYMASQGWYLRGDVGYAHYDLRGIDYSTSGGTSTFTTVKLKDSFSTGAGIGYRVNQYFRSDLTLDYMFKSSFDGTTGPGGPCTINSVTVAAPNCVSEDSSSFQAWSLMANAYVDLFTYGRVTAYAGAGLGATYVKWDTLHNTECNSLTGVCNATSIDHEGAHGWRATAALMAGASVKINCAWAADVNYRYRYINGGKMFEYSHVGTTGPGYTKTIHSHEARAGLRYSFGGCHQPPVYEPPMEPPVYK